MLFTYEKVPVRISKFVKAIVPKVHYIEKKFEPIQATVRDYNVIYQIHNEGERVIFYKKANIYFYNRIEGISIKPKDLKADIGAALMSSSTYKKRDFQVYIADEFVFVIHAAEQSSSSYLNWHVIIYDTERKIVSDFYFTSGKSHGGIYGFYYLKKCGKVILPIGIEAFEDITFYDTNDKWRGFNLTSLLVIDLNKLINNRNKLIDGYYYFIHIYQIASYYSKKHAYKSDTIIDYTIDVNSGLMYLVVIFKNRLKNTYETNAIVLEHNNLCDQVGSKDVTKATDKIKRFEIDLPITATDVSFSKNDTLLYLSDKRRKSSGIPKYLPIHVSSEFYDFMRNKLFHADMIFSSYAKPLIRDRYFNRVGAVLSTIESLKKFATHMPLQEDVIAVRSGYSENTGYGSKILAVLLICNLSFIKWSDF
jgi:hypothetical protein